MILVEDLHKSYNGNKAVDGISFAVKRGEVYAFLGENGAGKSTTINIICTILQKDKGKVTINGSELDKNDDKIKEDIGVVFQGSFLDKKLTVYENLATRGALYGFNKGEIKQRIASVTKRLDLESFLKQSYGTLSGGQRRRVDIARAILHRPKLLILDEPTTGLDPATRARVWDTIKQLQQQADLTVFFSTHYMEEAEYANTISIIKKGKLVATDTPYMLKQNYSYDSLHLYGRTKDIIKYLDKHQHQYIINNDFVAVKLKQSLESIDIINDLKGYLQSFEVQKGNMDTVFLTITGENDWQGEVSK